MKRFFAMNILTVLLSAASFADTPTRYPYPGTVAGNYSTMSSVTMPHHSGIDQGPMSVAIVLVNFPEDTRTPYGKEMMTAVGERLNQFIQNESYGRASINYQTFGWWTLPPITQMPNIKCGDLAGNNYEAFIEEVVQAGKNNGVDLHQFQRMIVYYQYEPKQKSSECRPDGNDKTIYSGAGRSGLEPVGGFNGVSFIPTVFQLAGSPLYNIGGFQHEFGHQLGFNHPSVWNCGPLVLGDAHQCKLDEGSANLSDPWDNMGGWDEFNAVEKLSAGWLESSEVTKVTESGIYELEPEELASSAHKLLTFPGVDPRYGTPMKYYVEFRQALGADAGPAYLPNVFALSAKDILKSPISIYPSLGNHYLIGGKSYPSNVTSGVLIRTVSQTDPKVNRDITTFLINANAASSPSVGNQEASILNAALQVGQTFTDPTTHTQLTVLSLEPNSKVTLQIKMNGQ